LIESVSVFLSYCSACRRNKQTVFKVTFNIFDRLKIVFKFFRSKSFLLMPEHIILRKKKKEIVTDVICCEEIFPTPLETQKSYKK